ncbi:MAG: MaoC family dehydratase [Deltaproteobacteria bacterium]|jgi:3-hydroxybutyryl-CoA dehydratase|nr:MaoC family dehydratase [Deltaproteobacteria bacterium]
MRGKTYDEIVPGEKASFSKTITEADIHSFSAITADFNPIHVDEVYAAASSLGRKMGGRIAQGMLSASLFSTLVGMYIPGKGALYVSQSCNFKRPVKIGDTLRAECEVVEKLEKNRIRLATYCVNQNGDVVVEGEAIAIAAKHVEDTM